MSNNIPSKPNIKESVQLPSEHYTYKDSSLYKTTCLEHQKASLKCSEKNHGKNNSNAEDCSRKYVIVCCEISLNSFLNIIGCISSLFLIVVDYWLTPAVHVTTS